MGKEKVVQRLTRCTDGSHNHEVEKKGHHSRQKRDAPLGEETRVDHYFCDGCGLNYYESSD